MRTTKNMCFIIIAALMIICPAFAEEQIIITPTPPEASIPSAPNMPIAFVPETQFEFKPVLDGTQITHDFVIKNMGGAALSIRDVITNCACATAEFPKEILPGNEGKITIKGNTTGYGGTTFERDIMVSTNDSQKSVFHIYLWGQVEEFANVDPKIVVLRGTPGQPIQSVVTINPRKEYPFKILSIEVDDAIKEKVKISMEQKEGKYFITVNNLQTSPGKYAGKLRMKTDSKFKPEMKMYIKGYIK